VLRKGLFLAVLITLALAFAAAANAATKTYQVTGPVLELRSDAIVVQKGTEKWEIARDANTKAPGDLKVGSKVTITYRMTATDVEVKPATATKASPKKK
jgi:GH43 family beta-xylosidase